MRGGRLGAASNRRPLGTLSGHGRGALRPCTVSITMHAESDRVEAVSPDRSKGAQRRRRLARGVDRWDLDRRMCAEPVRRVARVTLTIPEAEPEAAIGRVYRFLAKVRRNWLGTRYFCWLELQRRGAVHYHMTWLNPPDLRRVDLVAWVAREWGHGRTQVRFTGGRHSLEQELDYVRGYAKKMGRKSYQQRYDGVPRQLRTFMSQRLEIPGPELDHAFDRDVWEWRSAGQGRRRDIHPVLVRVGYRQHVVPAGGRCTALDHRRPRARSWRSPPILRARNE